MNYGRLEVKIKRVCPRKRAREHLKAHLPPAVQRREAPTLCSVMAESRAAEVGPVQQGATPPQSDCIELNEKTSLVVTWPELSEHLPAEFTVPAGHRLTSEALIG